MGLGNENGNRKVYDQNYFSRFSVTDQENKLRLGFRFSSGMLVPNISRLKDPTTFEYETLDEIFITPTKANILLAMIDKYEKEGKTSEGVGITSGLKETVSAIVVNEKSITIGKVKSNGEWASKSEVKFNRNYHYGIEWSDVAKNKFEQQFTDEIDYEMFKQLLKSFAYNMPGAIAYSVADLTRFDTSRAAGRLKPIYDKLGIEWGGNGGNRGSGNNFFNNNTRSETGTANHKELEDVIDELPFD